MTRLNISGLYLEADVTYVNEVLPEYVEFIIYYPKSHRSVDLYEAKGLREKLNKNIKVIGVFINQHIELIKTAYNQGVIDIARLSGDENEAYIETLKSKLPELTIIQSFRINNVEDLEPAKNSKADLVYLHLGKKWTLENFDKISGALENFNREYFLGGDINISNVSYVMSKTKPKVLSISTGLEIDSKKDLDKIKEFIKVMKES